MKYIIDVPDSFVDIKNGLHIPMDKTGNFRIDTGIKLTPYTEPDRKAIEDEVWDFVRIITDMTEKQRIECFGGATCDLDEYWTYQEAKAKYDAWKKEKEEIHVGDEVKFLSLAKSGVVVSEDKTPNIVGDSAFNVVWEDGSTGYHYKKDLFRTGRHFDEIEELMKKMRDSE